VSDYEEDDVVVEQVEEIAIYYNPKANVVIRQADSMGEDDAIVVIPYSHLKSVIKKLQQLEKKRPDPDAKD
tara:strand:- start:337 stop:549 length:213 start_codon:yes stop_codon:yes gene_type:complete